MAQQSDPTMIEARAQAAVRDLLSAGDPTERLAASTALITALLASLPDSDKTPLLQHFSLGQPATAPASPRPTTRTDPARVATMVREIGELRAELADAREALRQHDQQLADAQSKLKEQTALYRELRDRSTADRADLAERSDSTDALRAEVRTLRQNLQQEQDERRRQAERIVLLDTEVNRLRNVLRALEAEAANEPPPPPPARDEPATPPTPQPATPVEPCSTAPLGFRTFCETLIDSQKLAAQEVPQATDEHERRLGAISAALVTFQETVEKLVLAQLEELKRRHPFLGEHVDVLRYFRRAERTWWWSLTERTGRKVVPERHFASYLSQLGKMNYALLTAFYRVLTQDVSRQARELMDPAALRQKASTSRKEELWDYYEGRGSAVIPRQLGDDCLAQFARIVDELYRYGTSNR